jgi:hypothetical protein
VLSIERERKRGRKRGRKRQSKDFHYLPLLMTSSAMRDLVTGVAAAVTYAVIYFSARDVIVPLWFGRRGKQKRREGDAFAAEFAVR